MDITCECQHFPMLVVVVVVGGVVSGGAVGGGAEVLALTPGPRLHCYWVCVKTK